MEDPRTSRGGPRDGRASAKDGGPARDSNIQQVGSNVPRRRVLLGALPAILGTLPLSLRAASAEADSIQVLQYTPVGPSAQLPLAPPGTVTVIFTAPGSPLIPAIADAVRARQGGEISITDSLFREIASRRLIQFEAAKTIRDQNPVLSTITYGGKTLLEDLFIPPGSDFGLAFLPYNGARVAPEAFSLRHHSRLSTGAEELASTGQPIVALVLISEPPLTPAESAALSMIGSDDPDILIGRGASLLPRACAAFVAAVAAYAIVIAIVAVAVTSVSSDLLIRDVVHLTDEEVKALGPHGTAGELIARRHALLLSPAASL